MLTACSFHSSPPPFAATGYLADGGAVRMWRKDGTNGAIHLFTAFSPWTQGDTSTGEYTWQDEKLTLIDWHLFRKTPEHIKIRFDERGAVSFMQRDVEGSKQQLSPEHIALARYRAERMRDISAALVSGHVKLMQGRWQQDGSVLDCEGHLLAPHLDGAALAHIHRRQQHSSMSVSVAWLEAPKGSQLLLVANENFCVWQPQEKDF